MALFLLGATGRTGNKVLQLALEQGFTVHALIRTGKKLKEHIHLKVFYGNPNSLSDLQRAITGCTAVISVLNISRTSDFPWAPLRTPRTYLSQVMAKVLLVAQEKGIKRIVCCSAWGVGHSRGELPFWFRLLIDRSNIGVAYEDHGRQEELLKNSAMHWTIVRPVGLINTKIARPVKVSQNGVPKPNLLIARGDVARFMLAVLGDTASYAKKLTVYN